ncbi:hypothetical protein SAMN02982929_02963 [Saccharopolyspora kobensis]|uniref:Uncharacterized protein n=1 Tax=Saccharopolyspora kobensis TaxID=146035 RepID=A0A1H6BYQ4_9PSEU|nr:hypothetical protein SAMN02982929_02963 [Saccharopolyspora kobensis]SFC21184.1 hypothetical protein SAMN05216506_101202 [Saccharopolyspora kobensis]
MSGLWQAEFRATAPQRTVTQPGHKKPRNVRSLRSATTTVNRGEAAA